MNDVGNPEDLHGRKTFFLHPQKVIDQEVVGGLVACEYEVYTLRDHTKAAKALKANPNSLLLVNIDDGMKESEWESYIRTIATSQEYGNAKVGVISSNDDPRTVEKYVKSIALPLGYHILKDDAKENFKLVLGILKGQNAQGRRKFIRADCSNDPRSTLNMKKGNEVLHARLLDISAAGTACLFEAQTGLKPNAYLRDLQLNLRGVRLRVNGVFMGTRKSEPLVHVILFDPKTGKEVRGSIHGYIRQALQRSLDQNIL